MTASSHTTPLNKDRYDAVLFDLDGVITATNKNHFVAWKKLFDSYLKKISERDNTPFKEFDEDEMSEFVDGKPRYEGIRSFLEHRGITLPFGDPDDGEDQETVCGLGNQKNRFFNESIEADGVTVFEKSVELIHLLLAEQIRCAVVSSSKNCVTVLKSAGLTDLFEVRVDGVVAAEMKLTGKPTPDTYLKAAELMGVPAERAVVVEDAISGVQAGRAGNFGLVIGVDRAGQAEALKENGADVVVSDLGDFLA
ncbi:MAG: beta-phosphoglucomutase family hydrolase [Rhodospirillales bacterium]|nr:beta-phosphoglucomutase family hydrolase [Rhodospirillales bacterium]